MSLHHPARHLQPQTSCGGHSVPRGGSATGSSLPANMHVSFSVMKTRMSSHCGGQLRVTLILLFPEPSHGGRKIPERPPWSPWNFTTQALPLPFSPSLSLPTMLGSSGEAWLPCLHLSPTGLCLPGTIWNIALILGLIGSSLALFTFSHTPPQPRHPGCPIQCSWL